MEGVDLVDFDARNMLQNMKDQLLKLQEKVKFLI